MLKDNEDKETNNDKSNTAPKSSKDTNNVEKKKTTKPSFSQPIAEPEN